MVKVNRGQLLQALEMVSPGLSSRDIVEQSSYFAFKGGKVITFDDEIFASCDSPLKITGAVPSDPLKSILFKLKSDDLDMSLSKTKLLIKGKGETIGVTMSKKIELPLENLETPKKWLPLPDKFSEAVKLVESCAGRDASQFNLTCIHLHPKWIEAFDTMQLARFNLSIGIKNSTLVKQESLKHIIDLEMKEFAETPQWIHFRNAAGLNLSCRRFLDKFPVLDQIAQVKGKKIILPKGLADVADRAEVFSTYNIHENHVRLDIRPGWIDVKGTGQYGYYKGRRKIKYVGSPMCFLVHPQLLIQLVKSHNSCELCTGKIPALKATFGSFVFVTSLAEPPKEKPAKISKTKKEK
jgi:hypothetical protein